MKNNNTIFDPNIWFVKDLFAVRLEVPVYQRPYSWENNKEVKILLEDIYDAYNINKESTVQEEYYMSEMMLRRDRYINGKDAIYEIIDGQQRATTLLILLVYLYYKLVCLAEEKKKKDGNENITSAEYFCNIKNTVWKKDDYTYNKDFNTLTLNSIDKKPFKYFCDKAFTEPIKLLDYCKKQSANDKKLKIEKHIFDNFIQMDDFLKEKLNTEEYLKDFSKFLLYKVSFTSVVTECEYKKVFSIFEAKNSKGKSLETIDKFKNYIFSKIDEDIYDNYLELWGDLTVKTNDWLYEYFLTYIKGYLCFYRQNISIEQFKNLCNSKDCKNYYKANTEAEVIKKMLDDMNDKLNIYLSMYDANSIAGITQKTKFYLKLFNDLSFSHPKPLFMRMLEEYNNGKIYRKDVEDIIVSLVLYQLKFNTLEQKQSKFAITMYSDLLNHTYQYGVDSNYIVNAINQSIKMENITKDNIINDLKSMDAYERRCLTNALLSLYETYKENGIYLYDVANNKYNAAKSLDHLLVQKPDFDSDDFYYYQDNKYLRLKEEADFPNNIKDGMKYNDFKKQVLNKLGNLRRIEQSLNSSDNNKVKEINGIKFNSYKQIRERENDIINTIIDEIM